MAIGRLRAAIIVMVLAQHAMVAYFPFARVPQPTLAAEPRTWLAFPIVDPSRSTGVMVLMTFNDIFGMALMFLLSGLFVSISLVGKGSRRYLRDRAIRLGIPFLAAATVLTPIAYYPSYLVTTGSPSFAEFLRQWFAMGFWPGGAGPAWFLWVLLAFDTIAAVLLTSMPETRRSMLRRVAAGASQRPMTFWRWLVIASAIAYLPLALIAGAGTWDQLGPFKLQTSRVLHYLVYFLAGVAIGDLDVQRGLLAETGWLTRRWAAWLGAALTAFGVFCGFVLAAYASDRPMLTWDIGAALLFVVSCATSSFAVLAVFIRFGRAMTTLLDASIPNAYGIYLVHYMVVTWLQYALLSTSWPGIAKAWIVFLGAVACSWGVTAGLRSIPAVRRVL